MSSSRELQRVSSFPAVFVVSCVHGLLGPLKFVGPQKVCSSDLVEAFGENEVWALCWITGSTQLHNDTCQAMKDPGLSPGGTSPEVTLSRGACGAAFDNVTLTSTVTAGSS